MIADSRPLDQIFLSSDPTYTLLTRRFTYRPRIIEEKDQFEHSKPIPRRSIAIEYINFCVLGEHHLQAQSIQGIHTSVALGRRASAGTENIPGHSPEPGTSDQRRWDNHRRELDHSRGRTQSEVAEDGLDQGDSSVLLEVDWDRPMVRYLRWQRALFPLQPCAGCLPPSYVVSTPFEFP